MGFNDIKVFIRPHSSADEFTDTNECFRVGEVEACFVGDGADCDQALQEGDAICVGDSISASGCPVADHANLMRRMRIMVTLSQPVGEAAIITEAGLVTAPELALPSAEPEQPTSEPEPEPEPVPEAPIVEDPFIDTGGDEPPPPSRSHPPPEEIQVAVPDVFGLTLAQASNLITGVGLVVGNVTIQDQQTGSLMPSFIRSAHAQAACEHGTVLTQFPAAGTLVSPGTAVNMVICSDPAAIPEPSSLVLFAVGLGLLILFTWSRRRLR